MKLLILACVLSISAADLLQAATPLVDRSISTFHGGVLQSRSLSEVLAIDEPWAKQAEDAIRSELEEKLRETLNNMLQKIQEHVEHSKHVSLDLYNKVNTFQRTMKDLNIDIDNRAKEIIEKIKIAAKENLRNILEKLELGKPNLDYQMDAMARSKFDDFLELFKEKILSQETLEKIKQYIGKIDSDHPIVKELKDFVKDMKNTELRDILRELIERNKKPAAEGRGTRDNSNKPHGKTQDESTKFEEWIKDIWSNGVGELSKEYSSIKKTAFQFISEGKTESVKVTREALEFFEPYRDVLGNTWNQIVDALTEVIGQY